MDRTRPEGRRSWMARKYNRFAIGTNWSLLISASMIWGAVLITYAR